MSYPINYPTPQGANIQIFKAGGTTSDWVKPQGASFVWFALIGAGGAGSGNDGATGGTSGGSGAVTNCMVPAFLIPDVLMVSVGLGAAGGASSSNPTTTSTDTKLIYQQKDGTGYTLLTASAGGNGAIGSGNGVGGTATTSNYFSAMGFFQSIAGQDGGVASASSTTFLGGGTAGDGNISYGNYGYSAPSPGGGFSQISPIIVGVGGNGTKGNAQFGCGGGCPASSSTAAGGKGGDGLVVIISW
jgi:hypothetical protein